MIFHAHVYFDKEQESIANEVRGACKRMFSKITIGNLTDKPVGPHTKPMFQAIFETMDLSELFPWIMCNHKGLSVLIHPCTENSLLDHTEYAAWLGKKVPLNLDML